LAAKPMRTAEPIEITYRRVGDRYVFASADYKLLIVHDDPTEAAARFVRLAERLKRKGAVIPFRVEAYARLGPALKAIRDTGSICQAAPKRKPQPLSRLPWQMPGRETPPPPAPLYASWDDYLARTSHAERRTWCALKAKVANRTRLLSDAPKVRLTAEEVLAIMETAQGRCAHCGSLALEGRPSGLKGTPVSWAQVGRRIGSLDHSIWRYRGGDNDLSNLGWSCLWCNTWPSERRPQADDHGATTRTSVVSKCPPPPVNGGGCSQMNPRGGDPLHPHGGSAADGVWGRR
jgi:hypothetical protein